MRRRGLLLGLLLPFFLTGCWDQKDPEDREYIITLGIDRAETGSRFSFAQANPPDEDAPEPYTVESATLLGAVAQVDCSSSRQTDLGQLKTIIFSRDVLEGEDFSQLLTELERSRTVSDKVMLLATEDRAENCVCAALQEDSNTGLFLWDFYKNTAHQVAVTKAMDLDTFLTEWQERGSCAVLPRISVEGDKLRLGGGIAIGSGGVYPLEDREERGYLFLLGEAEGAILETEFEGATIPLEINRCKVRYAFSEGTDGRILCRISLPLEGGLLDGGGLSLSAAQKKELAAHFSALVQEEIRHTLEIAVRTGEDLYGILPRLRQSAPALAQGRSRAELWAAMEFEIEPELKLRDL